MLTRTPALPAWSHSNACTAVALPSFLGDGGSHQITALASSDPGVTGIGSTATTQNQQFFTLALPAG
jgi:hypothetical protein